MIVRTTMHPFDRKRNKTHIFIKTFDVPIDVDDVTGITKCGRKVYAILRTARPRDIRCKLCFKLPKNSAPATDGAASNTTNGLVKTAAKI